MYICICVCTLYVCIYMSVYTHAVWFIISTPFNICWGIITDINKDLAKIFITGKYWKQGTHQPIGDLLKKFWFRGILFSHLKPTQKNILPSLLPTHWDACTLSSVSGLPQQWLGEPSVQRGMAESTKGSPVCWWKRPGDSDALLGWKLLRWKYIAGTKRCVGYIDWKMHMMWYHF